MAPVAPIEQMMRNTSAELQGAHFNILKSFGPTVLQKDKVRHSSWWLIPLSKQRSSHLSMLPTRGARGEIRECFHLYSLLPGKLNIFSCIYQPLSDFLMACLFKSIAIFHLLWFFFFGIDFWGALYGLKIMLFVWNLCCKYFLLPLFIYVKCQ